MSSNNESEATFLAGGGEMGALMRAKDWSDSLGPPSTWSQSLRTAVRLILNTRHPMYIFWGPQAYCLYNDSYRATLTDERHPSSLGQPGLGVWAEIWDIIGPQITQVMNGGDATWHENQLVPTIRNGVLTEVYWTYTYSPIDDEGAPNDIGGVLVVCNETTSQVRDMQRLADIQQHFELALSGGGGIGTWDWDIVNDRVVADARFATLYGVSPESAATGAPIAEFFAGIHPDDLPGVQAKITAAFEGHGFNGEYRVVQPDGSFRWVSAQGRCSFDDDGKPVRFPGVSFDITDRRIADEKLRQLNTNLEQQVLERASERGVTWDVSPFLLSVIDLNDGTFIRVNPAWSLLLGWSEDEITGAPFLRFLHPDDLTASNEAFSQVARGEPVLNFVNRYRDKDGGYHWLSWVAVPENGKLYSTVRDVTAERQAAERLAATQDQLRQAQKMEAVGQLTGGLAHDFNNLLTIIRSSTDFLRRQNLPEEKRARYINAISDTADRAAKLTSQLLAFARRQPLLPTVFDVSAQVDTISVLIRQLLGNRITIDVKPCDGACFANADIGQFETALINLAVNARDAMNGEGRLVFQTQILNELPRVRTRTARPGRVVAVSVTDTGEGIDASKLEAIFEPFYTTKEVGKGTGLGLSQVFGFSQQSGGDIAVKSQLGQGATFTLYLPLAEPPSKAAANETPAQEEARSKNAHCILVVEDNQEVGAFSTELLHDLGYKTKWVSNGHEALEALAENDLAYDLVFTDVIMPGMNGVDLARTIRAKYPGLPVVLTSGYSNVLAEGDHGFQLVHKPYSVESLSRVLRKAIVPRRH